MKKYNLKDGMKKTGDAKGFKKPDLAKQPSGTDFDQTKQHNFQKQNSFVEIPANLSTLGIKDLKQILESLGIKSDDCLEKNDLINRLKDYQDNKKKNKAEQ